MMNRRTSLILIVILVLVLISVILLTSLPRNNTPTAAVIKENNGYFNEQGLDIEVKPFIAGRLALDAVLSGNADFAVAAETPLVYASLNGQEFYIIATTA